MPRRPRTLVDQGCYHIICRGNNRAMVFSNDMDRQHYLHLLAGYFAEHDVALYHYCLMSNHVHLVVRAGVGQELRRAMQRLNLAYAQHAHRTYDHVGHVWQDRFKSIRIVVDAHLLQCGAYVELNPVRAGLVQEPAAYIWSSYRCYAQGVHHPLIRHSPAYVGLADIPGDRQRIYGHFVQLQRHLPRAAVSHLLPRQYRRCKTAETAVKEPVPK